MDQDVIHGQMGVLMDKEAKEINTLSLEENLKTTFSSMNRVINQQKASLYVQEIGIVSSVGKDIVTAKGLPEVKAGEIVIFKDRQRGMIFNLEPGKVDIVLLDEAKGIKAGDEVRRTHQVMDVPVGESLLGRVIDPVCRPLDHLGTLRTIERYPIERESPPIMDREPVNVPLQTGILVIDALVPIGRGQRELILGDRQTGKTAIAVDTMINQKDKEVICIYCAVGQKLSSVARVVAQLKKSGAMEYSLVMVASGEDTPALNYIAPYAATSIGEYFMERGKDVLVIYDDLTHHARSYRELSLLLRRPPAREAYPGDIFYIHSRLLERATHLKKEKGGGSLTALPIIETQAQNLSAYIPTNLISITDGQIYLSPQLFQGGLLPAVDVGKSVSRVGGKTQLASYQEVVGSLRLTYSQFQELEIFSRFGTQLDESTIKILERGRRIREVLKQNQYAPYSVMEQIVILLMVNQGLWDRISLEDIKKKIIEIKKNLEDKFPQLEEKVMNNKKLDSDEVKRILDFVETSILKREEAQPNADAGNHSEKN